MPQRKNSAAGRRDDRERLLRAGQVLHQAQRGELSVDAALKAIEREGITPSEGFIGLNLAPTRAEALARLGRLEIQVKRARPSVRRAIASHLSDLEDALAGALVHDRLRRGKERLRETYQVRDDLELDF